MPIKHVSKTYPFEDRKLITIKEIDKAITWWTGEEDCHPVAANAHVEVTADYAAPNLPATCQGVSIIVLPAQTHNCPNVRIAL